MKLKLQGFFPYCDTVVAQSDVRTTLFYLKNFVRQYILHSTQYVTFKLHLYSVHLTCPTITFHHVLVRPWILIGAWGIKAPHTE